MPDLKKLQFLFQEAVLNGKTEFLSHITEDGKISPERRLNIYQHAYKARLKDTLQEDYPILHTMLGDEAYYRLCHAYIDRFPSEHPSLRYFGQHLEKFVSQEMPYAGQPIIREMARFEWTFHNVFDAPDAEAVTVQDVMALSPELWTTLRFRFHPSFHMASYQWNVAAVWASVQDEAEQPHLPQKMPESSYVIQWRYELKSFYRTLEGDEGEVLQLALSHKAFPELCEALAQTHGDYAPAKAAEFLKKWVTEGLIISLDHLKLTP